jgi:toxin YoeB
MEIAYTPNALKDIEWWKANGSDTAKKKISSLLREMEVHPQTGTGKPEILTGDYAGCWSRRINKKDRIIYEIHDEIILVLVLSMRGHYN